MGLFSLTLPFHFSIAMEIKITISQKEIDEFNIEYLKLHPRAKKVRIEKPQHPTLNWYMTANNLAANRVKQAWKDLMIFILQKEHLIDKLIPRCSLTYITFYPTKRKHDLDNITPKFILDGLVTGGFIADDNNECLISLTTQAKYDKDNPRIELHFTF